MCETQAINSVSNIEDRVEAVNSVSDVEDRIEFERSWEHLPDLLLHMIFSRISSLSHRLMFSVVCKSWNSIPKSLTPTLQRQQFQLNSKKCSSPPYLHFTNNKLIHPFNAKVYELKKFPEVAIGVQLRTAREDWLLFTQNNFRDITPSESFLFNPFTQKMIWLPNLLGNICYSMSFTSPPTFANFKVVAVRCKYEESRSIAIDTFKSEEDWWTSCEFKVEKSLFDFSFCNPVFCKGICYILDKRSRLLVHDPQKHTFFIHEAPESLRCDVREQYLLENHGKLLAVFVETSGSWVLVCRWNVSKRKWEKLESLGNNVLFVSRPCSLIETVTATELGDRIYFPRLVGDHCLFYSLSTKKFHTSNGSSFTTFHGSKSAFSSTWIKPTFVHADA